MNEGFVADFNVILNYNISLSTQQAYTTRCLLLDYFFSNNKQ